MLSFAQPALLFGLAALGIPVALHLMNRELPVRLLFPSIRFIQRAKLPRQGRRSLRDVIVLLLRLLLMAAAILALAGPRWQPTAPPVTPPGAARETMILVDLSASMSGWNAVERAREAVRELLDAAPPPETFGLLVSADRPLLALPPATAREEIRAALDRLDARLVEGAHLPALQQATSLFSPGARRRLAIVSDFQQSDWLPSGPPMIAPDVELRFLDVAPAQRNNIGIATARTVPLGKDMVRIIVETRNYGTASGTRRLTLRAGQETRSQDIDLPPLQTRRVAFVLARPESNRGEVTLSPEDDYAADDSYTLWLGAPPPVPILVVAPLAQEPHKERELFFLRKALEVHEESAALRFAVEVVEADFFFAMSLADIPAIVLLGAAGYFTPADYQRLRDYLHGGGLVLATPGNMVGHQFQGLRHHGLLGADMLGTAGETYRHGQIFGLGRLAADSVLGHIFENPSQTDLFLFPIYRYFRLDASPDAEARVLIETLDGDPALIERPVGRGRLFVSALAFDPTWSDLPMTGSFLPLIRGLLGSAVPSDHGIARLVCGQEATVPRDVLGGETVTAQERGAPPNTSRPTVFVLGGVPHEVNVSRRESETAIANPLDLRRRLTGRVDREQHRRDPAAVAATRDAEAGQAVDLWFWFAAAAALLMLAELSGVGWFDRRGQRAPG